jgi:hypothetical protein
MAADDLWGLVGRARAGAADPAEVGQVAARLVELLAAESPARIRELDSDLRTVMARAYGWPLWGAAYLVNGGCSDDGFDYFLGWLVGQGRAVYEQALAEPDSLADVVAGEGGADAYRSEDLVGAARSAYERATGADLPDGEFIARPGLGPGWDFDDPEEMRMRYPRLWARFGWA